MDGIFRPISNSSTPQKRGALAEACLSCLPRDLVGSSVQRESTFLIFNFGVPMADQVNWQSSQVQVA